MISEVSMRKFDQRDFNSWLYLAIFCTVVYFISSVAMARPVRVAVIDTGFDTNSVWKHTPKLCNEGSFSFVKNEDLSDNHGHGTHITGLIHEYGLSVDHCFIILKYYSKYAQGNDNLTSSLDSIRQAIDYHADVINYSSGGNIKSDEECSLVKKALDLGIKFVAAAGNDGLNLDYTSFYPAKCDSRVLVVEGTNKDGSRWPTSNYGGNTIKELGVNVLSILPNGQYGYMSGSSQATAIVTGKMLKDLSKTINHNKTINYCPL
jgi:subtilisin family serine protease